MGSSIKEKIIVRGSTAKVFDALTSPDLRRPRHAVVDRHDAQLGAGARRDRHRGLVRAGGWKGDAPEPVVQGWRHFVGSLRSFVETGEGQPW